jgi:hypothetical protein
MKAFGTLITKIREINSRYRAPRIQMSPAVRVSLMALRLYLFALVGLMVYKFLVLVTGS